MALCALLIPRQSHAAPTSPPASDAASRLELAESLRTADHPRFLRLLQQIRLEASKLSPGEQWYLRYLDAWQLSFQGDYDKADAQFRQIIDNSGDTALAAKASAVLMDDLGVTHRYEEALSLANRLIADLPKVKDKLARFMILANASQLLRSVGQYDLAARYAREMEETLPPGETQCKPMTLLATALYKNYKLTLASPELRQGIDTCLAAKEPVFANNLQLVMGALYLDEGQPAKTIALLHRIAPSIKTSQYYSHMVSAQVILAQAYWALGDGDNARKAALAALATSDPGDISESLRDAYEVLYLSEKKLGNAAAALKYYEQYVVQDKGYLDGVSAKAMAYQVVQQHILAQKLETEKLSKQNNILKLQQALDTKAVETSRLYIMLLLVTIASIALWLYRLKLSQLRFKKLSYSDGLTGIYNHQHFIGEAHRLLHSLEKKRSHTCLIAIDLDHFKLVNDTHGHAMGDAVLIHTVASCQRHLGPGDLFGRLGGEEFGILLHECSREQGMAIADRIRIAIGAAPVEKDGCVVSISASVGLAATETSGYELQRLYTEADAALYRAKRSGRNRVMTNTENGDLVSA